MKIKIIEVKNWSTDLYFKKIQELGRKNSTTLGFMPEGGFIDQANQGHILAAISSGKECVGYLMYRITQATNKAHIIHLCTDENFRRKGVARELVNHLIDKTKKQQLYGITFACRRDYNLHSMWSSFGFIAKLEKQGKSKEGHLLTIWDLEHEIPQLIKELIEQKNNSKIQVVIDANIFFDFMTDTSSDSECRESNYLLSDWLQEEIELCLTEEINNEINRKQNDNCRTNAENYTKKFPAVSCSHSEFELAHSKLLEICPKPQTDQDKSDLRQLARAIASESQIFVTRDKNLLALESRLYDNFSIQILCPTDLIIKLDNLLRTSEYQPVRLAGTTIEKRLIREGEQEQILKQFLMSGQREKINKLKNYLQEFLAKPNDYSCFVVLDNTNNKLSNGNNYIALFVYDWTDKKQLIIPLFRVNNGMGKLGKTVVLHLLSEFILEASNDQRLSTKITDQYLDKYIVQSIQDTLFVQDGEEWIKPHLVFSGTTLELTEKLNKLNSESIFSKNILSKPIELLQDSSINNINTATHIERLFHPCKIVDAEIPSFIIPIKAKWAEHLFDSELANQTLFGARKDLAFNREAVYYRSVLNSAGLSAPSRVLWYISHDQNYYGTQSLRACSKIDEVIIGKPKELYRQFKRLGIYDFQKILKIAKDNIDSEIMAIRFSYTELLKSPIPLVTIQKIVNKQLTFPSPYKISSSEFKTLYNMGMQI
jgi:predicted nucleic acid-binding protein/predicted GNAT family acetyltransferase